MQQGNREGLEVVHTTLLRHAVHGHSTIAAAAAGVRVDSRGGEDENVLGLAPANYTDFVATSEHSDHSAAAKAGLKRVRLRVASPRRAQ